MHLILLAALGLIIAVGPGLWVNAVMKRYHFPRDRYRHTGAEVARQLLDLQGLQHVLTETTEHGDHYDPAARAVRLSPACFNGKSLTALTVAAHEVGHAIQDSTGYRPLRFRTRIVRWAQPVEKLGAAMLMISPFSFLLTKVPAFGILMFLCGLATLGTGIVIHALTLPTEFDASFARALPLIRRHALLRTEDLPRARRLLTAAALTYVAGAMQSLLNIGRWWAILRR